jgi:hypothetical protein
MKKNYFIAITLLSIVTGFVACNKHHHDSESSITVANLSSTYKITSIIETETASPSVSYDVYPNLNACIKDDELTLNTKLTVNYSDAGISCSPKGDDSGTWDIVNDSLALNKSFYYGYLSAGKITSFDGKTLIVTSMPSPYLKHVTTLVKK